jgi:uncharacterized protein YcbX
MPITVTQLAIAPVKGMRLMPADELEITTTGPVGDRAFVLVDAAALGDQLGGGTPDPRRFRMTITIDGAGAWEEHGWAGREVAIGQEVALRVVDPVPRCVVTTRDPEQGRTDLPTTRALAELRGKDDVTFGIWCEVSRPGVVRRGDSVRVLGPASSP